MQTIAITGAAGRIGSFLRPRMRRPDRVLRLVDVTAVTDLQDGEEVVEGSITDRAVCRAAAQGAAAIVHLGGIPTEATWEDILSTNVDGTQAVLHAAVEAGVPRVVSASSNHAVGFWERPADGSMLRDGAEPRPDTFYGWSKAAGESLARLYHERFGLTVVNLRIGSCCERPTDRRSLGSWLSPDDVARLVEACLAPDLAGFHTVWGLSDNTRSWWSPEGGRSIGFEPRDDAEQYASQFPGPEGPTELKRVGGEFCTLPLGQRPHP